MIKINRYILSLLFLIPFGSSYSMEQEENSPIETYFLPEDNVHEKLFFLLDRAQKEVFVAVYWFTDHLIINKLISLKKRGVNVGVVVDSSSFNIDNYKKLIDKFLDNNISLIIFPSNIGNSGLMHNKFVVVDSEYVFNGSANFTKRAFNLRSDSNSENANIIHLIKTAESYRDAFKRIFEKSINSIIDLISNFEDSQLNKPEIFYLALKSLKKNSPIKNNFEQKILFLWSSFDEDQKKRIKARFLFEPPYPVGQKQKEALVGLGYQENEINQMSSKEAAILIKRILEENSF